MIKRDPKSDILEAAVKEFAKNYYDSASINNIIKASKTSKGTFYHYFNNKEDLYFQVIEKIVQEKLKFLNRRMNEEFKESREISLFDSNFKMITKIAMEFAAEQPLYYELGLKMLGEPNANILETIISKYGNQSEQFVSAMVEKMYERGQIKKSLSKELVVKLISYTISNYTTFIPMQDINNFNKMAEYLDQIYEILENGIKPEKAGRTRK